MAPKVTANAAKQALILTWFHKSAVAHSIKDLEKALPSVASINGMQVKDYLQALSDDNKIRVEKIGSGNWYWSFPSDDKKAKEAALEKVQEEHDKANSIVAELQAKVDEAGAAREEDEEMLMGSKQDRKSLTTKHADLMRELDGLRKELAAYSGQDPAEMEKKQQETAQFRNDIEAWTDHIMSMEGWFRERTSGDKESMSGLMRMCYGDDYDEEEGGLRSSQLLRRTSISRTANSKYSHLKHALHHMGRKSVREHPTHMASAADAPSSATQDNPPGQPWRGRGRGGSRSGAPRNSENNNFRGRGRGGRGRGRGQRPADGASQAPSAAPAPESQGSGKETNGKAKLDIATTPENTQAEEEPEGEVCFICASPVQHTAVAPCNHRTCHICSLRLRALYKTKTCAHCRTESDYVIFTDDATKNFDDFVRGDFDKSDDNLGIHFENQVIYEDTLLLLRYNCPDGECDVACLGWPDLHRHVKTAHGKVMCDLCTRNKKVFTHEHELFTPADLKKHQKFGDDNPGAVDQSGFKGHPDCGFCRQRFYGDDELYTHCRDKHERCHICDRRSEGRKQQYYVDYNELEVHFRKDHFLCPDRECLEKKFVVFDSEMDLKAHQVEVHPNGMSKDALRDARRVDMSGFQLRTSHEHEHSNRREGRGRGRGRDPNSEPLPPSSAQPMSRAELAYQRQMAVQSGPSATGRSFGGQLTSTEAFAARPAPRDTTPSTVTASRPTNVTNTVNNVANNLGTLNLEGPPSTSAPRTQRDHARLVRHNAVTDRALAMLNHDMAKFNEFTTKLAAYRTSSVSAAGLIESFFAVFDTSPVELGKLVKEIADIYEIPGKREDLLKAWGDWKAINEDYPSLPGSATGVSLSGGPAAHGGSRLLKLKSSTAQSSRSAVSKKASWATTSSSSSFPSLPAPSSSGGRIGAKPGQTPWATSAASTRVSPMPSRASSSVALDSKAKGAMADAFPALPAAPKPTSTLFTPGYSGAGIRRDNSGRNTAANAWTTNSAVAWQPNAGAASSGAVAAGDEGATGKKKGKKQTLFHFG
ncbi:hypothetical protein EJ04DRAFT_532810 [Polyplosphaeria fusca]|uniref:RING-type E3 ubiquitin transferase n=1 Tax=Polyplosphaeria fusca TaxID=682080 RepID=A0A9P4R6D6_9PLEO|nr:hypothetical protein EJ04DRAFT_532810 [Polyplosphaeria fusca]